MNNRRPFITREQIKMALVALDWTQTQLGKKAKLHRNTISNALNDKVSLESLGKIRKALEKAGLEILEPGQNPGPGGSGIRWQDQGR